MLMKYKLFENGVLVGYSDTRISGAVEMTEEEILELKNKDELRELRQRREDECFSIVNQNFIINGQSKAWFDTLTPEQKADAYVWVQAWRDVTETKIIPEKPSWLK